MPIAFNLSSLSWNLAPSMIMDFNFVFCECSPQRNTKRTKSWQRPITSYGQERSGRIAEAIRHGSDVYDGTGTQFSSGTLERGAGGWKKAGRRLAEREARRRNKAKLLSDVGENKRRAMLCSSCVWASWATRVRFSITAGRYPFLKYKKPPPSIKLTVRRLVRLYTLLSVSASPSRVTACRRHTAAKHVPVTRQMFSRPSSGQRVAPVAERIRDPLARWQR